MDWALWRETVAVGTHLGLTGAQTPHSDCWEHFSNLRPGLTACILDNLPLCVTCEPLSLLSEVPSLLGERMDGSSCSQFIQKQEK